MTTSERDRTVSTVRKRQRVQAFDDNRKLMHFAKQSSRRAIEEMLDSGVAVVYVRDGNLVRQDPDHTVTVIKELESHDKFNLREYLCQG